MAELDCSIRGAWDGPNWLSELKSMLRWRNRARLGAPDAANKFGQYQVQPVLKAHVPALFLWGPVLDSKNEPISKIYTI